MSETKRGRIADFLEQRRFAMVGVSHNTRDFSRTLFRAFLERGYDVVPVHPSADEMDGKPVARSLSAITPPPESVLLMTPPSVTEVLVHECAAVGVKRIWMYRATGAGAVSAKAIEFCRENGIQAVPGECPMMFLRGTGWIHRVHGWVRRITAAD